MLEKAERVKVISRIKAIVVKHHFNIGGVDYADWSRTVDQEVPALLATDEPGFEEGIRRLLCQLQSSHVNFYHRNRKTLLPQHVIGATLRAVSRKGAARWMFQDVFEDSLAAHAGIRAGQFLTSVNGCLSVPPDLPTFAFGQQHQFAVQTTAGEDVNHISITVPPQQRKGRRPPLVEVKSVNWRMSGEIGILKIPFFSGAFGIRFSKLLDAAVDSLKTQGCSRLIVDLRGCIGGSLGFARLASYLCPNRMPIGYDVTRARLQQGYNVGQFPRVVMPSTKLGLLFCIARFSVRDKSLMLLTQGLGEQPFHGRVVVLINEWTNSAGEMAAQFVKETKLGTVIGTQTRGNVLGATTFKVSKDYELYLPIFGWYSPAGRCNEGRGVQPDVEIDIDPERLASGDDSQMKKALEFLQ